MLRWIAMVYSLFVIYGSLVPLKFVPISMAQAIQKFEEIPFLQLGIASRADWVANLLLFIPLGLLWAQLILPGRSPISKWIIRSLLAIAFLLFSTGIEFTQLFFPQRTVSLNDIYAEITGGVVGLLVQGKFENWITYHLGNISALNERSDRVSRLMHCYIFILFTFSVLPLDLTISPVEIYHKLNAGRVILIPFSGTNGGLMQSIYETLTDIIIWIPVGYLLSSQDKKSRLSIASKTLLIAGAIEICQLFVYSRTTDLTDIILAVVGGHIGDLIQKKFNAKSIRLPTISNPKKFFLFFLWLVSAIATFWFPFDFQANHESIINAAISIFQVPFSTYYAGTEFHAINELLRKLSLFFPGGIILGLYKTEGRIVHRFVAIFIIAFTVEVGQAYLPLKTGDITDVILEFFGGALGIYISRWIKSGKDSHISPENPQPKIPYSFKNSKNTKKTAPKNIKNTLALHYAALCAAIAAIFNLPFVPYNIRELSEPGILSLVSINGIAISIFCTAIPCFYFATNNNVSKFYNIPLVTLIQSIIVWSCLRMSVPLESIHDIIGSPVLNWPWEWEMIGRFIALYFATSLAITGGTLITSLIHREVRLENVANWTIWCFLLAWPLHWIIVEMAATDNLTELMSDGGSFLNSFILSLGLISFTVAASDLSWHIANHQYKIKSAFISIISLSICTACFWFGCEQTIYKYGKIFSTWQFILSTDRQNYATGINLYLRFGLAIASMAIALSLVQISGWLLKNSRLHHN